MEQDSKIYIAGHRGLIGSAMWRSFERHGYKNLIGRTHAELDLTNQQAVETFFSTEKPEYVVLVAAKVGGIFANNTFRGQFIYENMMIEMNVIHAAYKYGVKKLLFLGSNCIYPKITQQPIKEEYLLTGALEPTNEPYAIAKIAGIRMCDAYNRQYGTNFIAAMPVNMFGPGDNYHPQNAHVLPAMIRKSHLARSLENDDWDELRRIFKREYPQLTDSDAELEKWLKEAGIEKSKTGVTLTLWGTGTALRECLYSDDLADACIFMLERVDYKDLAFTDESGTEHLHVNIGSGVDAPIREIANTVKNVIGFSGQIGWDPSKPDGTPRKLMDCSRINALGWKPKYTLEQGIAKAYEDFIHPIQSR